jgi:hypothetical protein
MKITACVLVLMFALIGRSIAEETAFRDVKLASAKGTLTKASLTFSDQSKAVIVQSADGQVVTIPYNQIDNFSYEYTKKHRIEQGVALGLLSPGAGIIVALTRSKGHWLDIDFHEQNVPKTVVLRLDKRDYQKVCDAAKAHTGKEVAILGRTTTRLIKARSRTEPV